MSLDHVNVETGDGDPKNWLTGDNLVILDTPRSVDVAKVEQRIGTALRASQVPWVRIGGGPPTFGNLPPQQARPLIGYYAGGGEASARDVSQTVAQIAAIRAMAPAYAAAAILRHLRAPSVLLRAAVGGR